MQAMGEVGEIVRFLLHPEVYDAKLIQNVPNQSYKEMEW